MDQPSLLLTRGALQGTVLWLDWHSFAEQKDLSPTATRESDRNNRAFTLCSNELVFLLVPLQRKGEKGRAMKDEYLSNTRVMKCIYIINKQSHHLLCCSLLPVQRRGCSLQGEKQHRQRGRNNGKSPCKGSLPQSNTPHADVMWERPHCLAQSTNEVVPSSLSAGIRPGIQSIM